MPPANERQQSRMVFANTHCRMNPGQLLISPILTQYKVGLSSNIDVHRMFFWVTLCGCQYILMSSGYQCDLRTYIIFIQTEMMHTCECKHCLQRVHQNGSRLDSLTDVQHGPSGENVLDPLTVVKRHITSRLKVISSFPLLKYLYDM